MLLDVVDHLLHVFLLALSSPLEVAFLTPPHSFETLYSSPVSSHFSLSPKLCLVQMALFALWLTLSQDLFQNFQIS